MNCWEEILKTFPCLEEGKFPTINDKLNKRLNQLTKHQCNNIAVAISLEYHEGVDLESFIERELKYYEVDDLLKNLENIKSAISRWDKNLPMSKKDLAFVLGISQKQVDNIIQMGIPCSQLVEGGKVFFTPNEVKSWLEAKNLRQER